MKRLHSVATAKQELPVDTTILDLINFGKVSSRLSELANGAPNSRIYLFRGGDSDHPGPLVAIQPTISFSSKKEADTFVQKVVEEFGVWDPNFGTPWHQDNQWHVLFHITRFNAADYGREK